MNCREASVQISLHVGDDLPAADVPALEGHLEHCAICEAEYESYASARDALLLVADEYSGTTDLWGEIESQLVGAPAAGPKRAWYRLPLFASGMAAALLIAASSPFWGDLKSSSNPMQEMVESAAVPTMHGEPLNISLGIPDVTPANGSLAIPPLQPGVDNVNVDLQDTRNFLESTQGRGLLQPGMQPDPHTAVPVSNPNRGAY